MSGMENHSTISLIEDAENILNKFFEEFHILSEHKEFQKKFNTAQKNLRTIKKDKHMKQKNIQAEIMRKQMGEQRQKEKEMKQVKKVGKPIMKRVWAPSVKRDDVKVSKRSEQEEDYYKYMGMELN